MTKTQEEHLCRDIRRIAQGIERIANAVEKKDDGEKIEVIRCEDCVYWDTEWESTDERYHYCWKNDSFEESDFWCKDGERKVKNDGQTDFTASCD